MKSLHRSIFREQALRCYVEGKQKAVLPLFVSPRTFAYLWSILGLLCISSLIAWFTKVPVYASGSAVVVRLNGKLKPGDAVEQGIVVAAFFPSQHLSHLQTSQKLFLSFDAFRVRDDSRFSRSIIAVEPKIISPDSLQKRFGLNAQIPIQPSVVAIAPLEPISTMLPASAYLGSVGHAEAEVGSQRLVSLLPLIGQFFQP